MTKSRKINTHRILSLLLSLVFMLSLMPTTALAAKTEPDPEPAGAAVLTGETDVTMQKGVEFFGGGYVLTPPEGVIFTNIEWSVSGDFPAGISFGVNRAGGDGSSRAFLNGIPTAMTDAPVSVTINAEATDGSNIYTGSLAVSITVEDSPAHMKLDELIQSADCEVPMETANTPEAVVAWVQNIWLPSLDRYNELVSQLGNGWSITAEDASTPEEDIGGFMAAVAGTEADPDGTDGSLTVRFRLDENYNYLENSKVCTIKATAYSVSPDTTTCTITYEANGGSGEMTDDAVTGGTAFILPECGFTPPRGKTFKAWSIGGEEYAPGDIVYFEENATVTAVWEDIADIDPVEILLYAMLIEGTSSGHLYEGELLDDYGMPTLTDFSKEIVLPGDYIDEYITVDGVVYEFKGIAQYTYDEATGMNTWSLTDSYTIAATPEYGTEEFENWYTPISNGIYAAYMVHTHSFDDDTDTTCDCGYKREVVPDVPPPVFVTFYTICAYSGKHGSVSNEGLLVYVKEGDNVTFRFYPDKGYEVSAIWVDDLLVNHNGLNYDHYWNCDGCDECWWIDWSQWYDYNDYWYGYGWTDWQDGITFYDVDADHELYVEFAPTDSSSASAYYYDLDTTAWYHEATDFVIEKDIMKGVGGKYFDPNGTTTRGQLVTMLYRLAGEPKVSGGSEFLDVPDDMWYTDAVVWATKKGIVEGYGNGYFGVNDIVTREQTVTILYRYAKYMGISVSKLSDLRYFLDNEDVSDYAEEPFGWAVSRGIIEAKTAFGDSLALDPQGSATRVQMADILMRFCELET